MPTSALHFHLAPICFSPSLCSTLATTPALISLLSVIASDLIPPFHSLRISPFSISTQYLITFLLCSFFGGRRDVSTRTVQLVFNLYSAVRRHINSCHSHGFDIKRTLRPDREWGYRKEKLQSSCCNANNKQVIELKKAITWTTDLSISHKNLTILMISLYRLCSFCLS